MVSINTRCACWRSRTIQARRLALCAISIAIIIIVSIFTWTFFKYIVQSFISLTFYRIRRGTAFSEFGRTLNTSIYHLIVSIVTRCTSWRISAIFAWGPTFNTISIDIIIIESIFTNAIRNDTTSIQSLTFSTISGGITFGEFSRTLNTGISYQIVSIYAWSTSCLGSCTT